MVLEKKISYVFIFNPIRPPDHVTDDVINLILHSHRVVDQTYEVSDFSDKDFDSTNYGWNTTSAMTLLLSPYNPQGELAYAKCQLFLLSGFRDVDSFFFFNPIWLPYHVTYDVRFINKIFSMESPSLLGLKFCIDQPRGCREIFC